VHHGSLLLIEFGAIVLALGFLAAVASRFSISPIPLYLLAGLAFGQGGVLPLATSQEFVSTGAEIGVILLLFTLGLEYTAQELVGTLRSSALSGLIDLVLNATPGVLVALLLGWGPVAGHAPPAFLAYFACGMLVALAVERSRATNRELSGLQSGLLAGGAVALLVANGLWHGLDRSANGFAMEVFADLAAALAFGAIIASIVMGTGAGLRWLAWRPLVWVGTITYGLYLWHIPVIVWLRGAGLLPGGALSALVALPIAVALGAASWYLLEQPLMNRAARLRRTAPATANEARSARSRWRSRARTAPRPASWSARAVAERR